MDVGTGVPVLKDSNEPAPGTGGPSNFTTRYASARGPEERRLASDGSIVRRVLRRRAPRCADVRACRRCSDEPVDSRSCVLGAKTRAGRLGARLRRVAAARCAPTRLLDGALELRQVLPMSSPATSSRASSAAKLAGNLARGAAWTGDRASAAGIRAGRRLELTLSGDFTYFPVLSEKTCRILNFCVVVVPESVMGAAPIARSVTTTAQRH